MRPTTCISAIITLVQGGACTVYRPSGFSHAENRAIRKPLNMCFWIHVYMCVLRQKRALYLPELLMIGTHFKSHPS